MLSIHRGGKKHQEYYKAFQQRKAELQQEKDKRQALQTNGQSKRPPAPKPLPPSQVMLFSVMSESNIPYNSMTYQYNPEPTPPQPIKPKSKPDYVFPLYSATPEKKKRKNIGPQPADGSFDSKKVRNSENVTVDQNDPDYKEKMFLAGWRWDSRGNMYKVQDPTVEFDSEEEQEEEEVKEVENPVEITTSKANEPTAITTDPTRKPISIDLTKPRPKLETNALPNQFKSLLPKISPSLPPSSVVQKAPVRYQPPAPGYVNDPSIPAPPPPPPRYLVPRFIPPPPPRK
eukprot:TRINITY_DN6670_c0_g1_i1.p1 TRINITY_DN6670_c0_g1~~TRINITY_DN6670_c0_g1_i1.p1  ORF type:complete len:287 (-),score=82.10 TRINITY_DN6670_c0_g1_i1:152-1012(-)